jgi:hypothetical protein
LVDVVDRRRLANRVEQAFWALSQVSGTHCNVGNIPDVLGSLRTGSGYKRGAASRICRDVDTLFAILAGLIVDSA